MEIYNKTQTFVLAVAHICICIFAILACNVIVVKHNSKWISLSLSLSLIYIYIYIYIATGANLT